MTKCTLILLIFALPLSLASAADPPNVILVMTDDQGYGDLACHGNPLLKTPGIDRLHADSIRLTDMHVMPFCTPTRASLMTGRSATRTGAYRTSSGRTLLHTDEVTMADVFTESGYATGIFGKWHLGDNYPHRPQDRGFQTTLWHRCGGVGQSSDYFGNDYFDDVYDHNGVFEKFTGYCTDIWFDGAIDFIESNVKQNKPFFAYVATNAPHIPFNVAEEYSDPYKDSATWKGGKAAKFYGMIANIDENIIALRDKLQALGVADNTIFIFMTDNGTSGGVEMDTDALPAKGMGYNAGMRGRKASIYDGGHRVPFFIYWPNGGLIGGRDIDQLAAGYDILPTLIELCNLKNPGVNFDGRSLASVLAGKKTIPNRQLVLQYLGGNGFTYLPEIWTDSLVMTEQWRLVEGKLLFDIEKDPSQSHDIASDHPAVVTKLRQRYKTWWDDVAGRIRPVRIHLGNPAENPVTLTVQDWYMPIGNPPNKYKSLAKVTAPWMVHIERPGRYKITLNQWPTEANTPIIAQTARVAIAGVEAQGPVAKGAISVSFEMTLPAGDAEVETFLTTEQGEVGGAYFTYVEYLGD